MTGVRYIDADGDEHMQRADAVAVAGYSIETPRLLLNSTSRRFPHGLANSNDQVGRCVMVQGASQVAGRFPEEMRMYKAPPPEIASEQFYETDPARGFARGFSIQTVGPLPIEWAQHVLADGHWGRALREYMRDYNHWYTLGVLCELLPLPENRVTVTDEVTDSFGLPVARMDYSQCENDRRNIAYAKAHAAPRSSRPPSAQDVLVIDRYAHLVGGCRMGSDPERSVVDADHRAWEVENLFIADGSVMPTQGSANPALTIMALASRLAERLDLGRRDPAAAARRPRRPRRRARPSPSRPPVAAEDACPLRHLRLGVEDPVRALVVVVVGRREQVDGRLAVEWLIVLLAVDGRRRQVALGEPRRQLVADDRVDGREADVVLPAAVLRRPVRSPRRQPRAGRSA